MEMNKILLRMEYNWRIYRLLRKILNYMVGKGMKLNSLFVYSLSRRLEDCYDEILKYKDIYETKTGITITFYKRNII